jgi:hypothetical protein
MASPYLNAQWGINTAAAMQAASDVKNTEEQQGRDYLYNDFDTRKAALKVLASWKKNGKTAGIFAIVPKSVYEQLTDDEKDRLVDQWINEYVEQYMTKLREKLRG